MLERWMNVWVIHVGRDQRWIWASAEGWVAWIDYMTIRVHYRGMIREAFNCWSRRIGGRRCKWKLSQEQSWVNLDAFPVHEFLDILELEVGDMVLQ